jgi:cobalt/nickel transport system permease protein
MVIIDKLAYSSKLRYKSPALKASFAVGTLLICVGSRSFIISLITLAVMAGLAVYASRISILHYLKLMSIPFGFMMLGTAAIIVSITDSPPELLSIPVGGRYLAVSHASLMEGLRLSGRGAGFGFLPVFSDTDHFGAGSPVAAAKAALPEDYDRNDDDDLPVYLCCA